MAWEKFQKKHYTRMKSWHGKRLSCRIDGVEVGISAFNLHFVYVQNLMAMIMFSSFI